MTFNSANVKTCVEWQKSLQHSVGAGGRGSVTLTLRLITARSRTGAQLAPPNLVQNSVCVRERDIASPPSVASCSGPTPACLAQRNVGRAGSPSGADPEHCRLDFLTSNPTSEVPKTSLLKRCLTNHEPALEVSPASPVAW